MITAYFSYKRIIYLFFLSFYRNVQVCVIRQPRDLQNSYLPRRLGGRYIVFTGKKCSRNCQCTRHTFVFRKRTTRVKFVNRPNNLYNIRLRGNTVQKLSLKDENSELKLWRAYFILPIVWKTGFHGLTCSNFLPSVFVVFHVIKLTAISNRKNVIC